MQLRKITSVILTIIIHLFVLYLLLPSVYISAKKTEGAVEEKIPLVTLLNKNQTIREVTNKDGSGGFPFDTNICTVNDKEYKGVGFIYNPGTQKVIYAPEYYPAYKAGLRVGDYIIDVYAQEIDGHIEFEVERNGKKYKFRIKTENICYKE